MLFEQTMPDGRTLEIAWLEAHGDWHARFADDRLVRRGDTAAEAIAAISGEPQASAWIVAAATFVETVLDLDRRATRRA